ncbi:MAG: maleylacetoacetate isomerase [Polyangiaceae bacterium]
MSSILLYSYWRSSSAYRVRFALAVKKLAFQTVPVNILKGETHSPEHVKRSPTGHVPCLVIDGKTMIESVAIIELLDTLYPDPPLYPQDPWEKARVRALVEVVNSGIQPLQNSKVQAHLSSDPEVRKAWAAHFNVIGLRAFESLLEIYSNEGIRGKYTYGDTLTAADIFLVPQVYSAKRFDIDVTQFPRVYAAWKAASATDAANSALPENQPDAVK